MYGILFLLFLSLPDLKARNAMASKPLWLAPCLFGFLAHQCRHSTARLTVLLYRVSLDKVFMK